MPLRSQVLLSLHFARCQSVSQSVQLLICVWLFVTPWTAARQPSLPITNSWSLLKLIIVSVVPSNHLILCHPLLLPPSIFSSIRVFSSELVLHIRWPKYWSFSFSTSPSNEYLGLIFFRMDWLDFLAVQGALKSLLQHHSYIVDLIQDLFWHDHRVAFCITGANYLPFHVQLPTSGPLTVVREISFYFWLRLIKLSLVYMRVHHYWSQCWVFESPNSPLRDMMGRSG